MARDNSGYPPLITSFPRDIISPYEFPIGTTRIIYTARDRSGNSQSCVFTVIIIGRKYVHIVYYLKLHWHSRARFRIEPLYLEDRQCSSGSTRGLPVSRIDQKLIGLSI